MATVTTTGLYEFDPRMEKAANKVVNERHVLQAPGRDDFFFIIPKAAPYFVRSLKVFNNATGAELRKGVDYTPGHFFIEAMEAIDTAIAGSIRILNHSLTGVLRLEYHTLGGDWGHDDASILAELSNRQYNPLVRSWGQIKELPYSFPVVPHDQSIDTLIGSPQLAEAIEGISKAIEATAAGSTQNHIEDKNNPHGTTAFQVGLGNVPNWAVATEAQARAASSQTGFMTPYLTGLTVQQLALVPLNAHINNKNNPHGTNAEHVGLGLVANYPPASPDEARDPTVNNRTLTPYTASLLMASQSSAGQYEQLRQLIQSHIDARGNVHGLTADTLGVYTKSEVEALMQNVSAQDTPRFAGMTEAEWRETLPTFQNLTDIVNTIGTEFNSANQSQLQVSVEDPRTSAEKLAEENAKLAHVHAEFDHYYVYGEDRNIRIVGPAVSLLTDTIQDGVDKAVFLNGASYWIEANGAIRAVGPNIVALPAAYAAGTGFLPANASTSIVATKTAVYATNAAGRLVRLAGGTATVLQASGAFGATCNNEHYQAGEFVLQEMTDGRVIPYGLAAWVNAANSVINSLTSNIKESVIGHDRWVMLLENGTVRIYTINRASGVVLTLVNNPTNMPASPSSLSGTFRHYSIMNEAGDFVLIGNNDDGQLDVTNDDLIAIACGCDFTVTIDSNNHVKFWGDSPDNSLLFKAA